LADSERKTFCIKIAIKKEENTAFFGGSDWKIVLYLTVIV
jgi:hypothetical protein